jgi:hypothetical protein
MRAPLQWLILLALLPATGCVQNVVTPLGAPVAPVPCTTSAPITEVVVLIGDAGEPTLPPKDRAELIDPVLRSLRHDVGMQARNLGTEQVTTIFLGDNVYWDGLAPKGQEGRRHDERVLEAQIAASEPAPAIFLLGNHDWDAEGAEGWERALAQRRFLERVEDRSTMMMGAARAGYMRLDVHGDGSLSVTVLAIVDGHGSKAVFHHCLAKGPWKPWRPPSDAPHADRQRTL